MLNYQVEMLNTNDNNLRFFYGRLERVFSGSHGVDDVLV